MRGGSQTATEERRARAAEAVPHLSRAAQVRGAMQESGLRLRLCVTEEAAEKERGTMRRLREEHAAETMRAAEVLARAHGDSPLLFEAVQERLASEVMLARQQEQQQREHESREWDEAGLHLTLAQERSDELRRVEQDVAQLGEIMADLSMLTAQQQPQLDLSQLCIESAKQRSEEATEQLRLAEKAVVAGRKRKLWLALGVVAVVLTAGVALVIWKLV